MDPSKKTVFVSDHSDKQQIDFEEEEPKTRKDTTIMMGGIAKMVLRSVMEQTASKFDYDTTKMQQFHRQSSVFCSEFDNIYSEE